MAGRGKGSAAPRGLKSGGQKGTAKKTGASFNPPLVDDDPYRDLKVPDDEHNDPDSDEYIWPEFEEDDEDRI